MLALARPTDCGPAKTLERPDAYPSLFEPLSQPLI